jgi:Cu(I)/Ag(I) efflux system protein CusF
MKTIAVALLGASLAITSAAIAQDKTAPMDHSGHGAMKQDDHSKMDHSGHGGMSDMQAKEVAPGTEAAGTGVINSIDAGKKQVNLTHEPMPDLGWPTMTMDLPVTSKVALDAVKPGDKVDFRLKLGRDKVYRVIEMTAKK